MSKTTQNRIAVRTLTQFSILLAIEAIFCFVPILGSLPAIGPIVATTAMIPVCITGIMLGPKAGSLMGGFAGLFSFLIWTFSPPSPISAFVFTPFYSLGEISGNFGSVLICFVPRILVGTVAGLVYKSLSKALPGKDILAFTIAGALGSLTNTVGVMGGIWVFFGEAYASIVGSAILVIIGTTVLFSGVPEAVLCAVASAVVCKPLKVAQTRRK